jgi:hypothetical protein
MANHQYEGVSTKKNIYIYIYTYAYTGSNVTTQQLQEVVCCIQTRDNINLEEKWLYETKTDSHRVVYKSYLHLPPRQATYKTTCHRNPEDHGLHVHCCDLRTH